MFLSRPTDEWAPHSAAPPDAILTLDDVVVSFGNTPVLSVPSARVTAGSCLCVTGRNGSGKSTLLRLVSGLLQPSSGQVTVFGVQPDERSSAFRRDVAALLAVPPLAADLTMIEHLALVGTSWGRSAGDAVESGQELLDRLDVGYVSQRFPREVSAGERQAFSLAMVLSRPSRLLVLDEPERHLDDERLDLLAELLRGYQDGGGTVVTATHSNSLVTALDGESLELERP